MNTYSGVSGAIPFTRLKLKDFSLSFLHLWESNGRLSKLVQKIQRENSLWIFYYLLKLCG